MAKLGITIVARAKHRDLYQAAKKAGSVVKLAEHLGIGVTAVYEWIRLTSAPPLKPRGVWTEKLLAEVDAKLTILTGKGIDELFPAEMREREWLKQSKVREIDRDVDVVDLISSKNQVSLLPSPEDIFDREEMTSQLNKALKTLTERQRSILQMRYGLNGVKQLSLDETAGKMKVSRERIRQIEAKAVRNLFSSFGVQLAEFIPETHGDLSKYDNRVEVSLKERYGVIDQIAETEQARQH